MVNYLQIRLKYGKVAMAGVIDNINGSLRMRTRGEGGVEPLRTPCVQGEGGSENSDLVRTYLMDGPFAPRFHAIFQANILEWCVYFEKM